jgi:putative Holliday junction resolvase
VGGGRILGIDPGTKRFGLAVSDELGVTAQGLETFVVAGGADFIDHVGKLVEDYAVRKIVIGLPLSMSGNDIEGTGRSRTLAARIAERCGVAVELRDERMTSREAERVIEAGGAGETGDVDRLAAVLLLQSYLDERSGQ